MRPATGGSPTRPTSRSPAGGRTCTGPSTSTAGSSACCCPDAVTWLRPGDSSSALRAGTVPVEVTTDRTPAYPRVLDELIPSALHTVERYANNPVETDLGRLKARLRPMRVQNVRRGHYELAIEVPDRDQLRRAFDQLAMTICQPVRCQVAAGVEPPDPLAQGRLALCQLALQFRWFVGRLVLLAPGLPPGVISPAVAWVGSGAAPSVGVVVGDGSGESYWLGGNRACVKQSVSHSSAWRHDQPRRITRARKVSGLTNA